MTEQKQPEALRLANSLQAVRRYKAAAELRRQHAEIEALQDALAHKDQFAEQLGRELAKADSEAKELRAKLNELEKQEPVAFVNEHGFIIERDDMQISSGEKLYLAAGARPVEPAPAGEHPSGAIVNGRTHIERLEATYQFECEAGPLGNCKDWQGLKRCFEYLIGRIDADRAMRAAQPAPGAGDQVQMILKHRLMRKVEGDWLAASEFMTGEPDPSWLAKTEESPEEWRIEQVRRVSGEQIQAGLTRAFASWKKPAPAAQDDEKDAAQLYPVVIDGLLWLCAKHGGTFKPVDDCAAVNPPLSWKNALAANKKEPT